MPIHYGDTPGSGEEEAEIEALLTETTGPLNYPLPPSPAPFDPDQALAKLLSSLEDFRNAGLIQQRPDGSFMLPGQKNSQWDERLKVGSTCLCPSCTPHNQRHWICMVCHSVHEWVLVMDRPRTMRTQLGSGGVAGFLHLVCSNECALEYRRRLGMGEGVAAVVPGQERPIPIAGGDDDPGGFLQRG